MALNFQRHTVQMSDREVVVIQRAVKVYLSVVTILGAVQPTTESRRTETSDLVHINEVMHGHTHTCTCPVPQETS
jgi:hypothetical protein